MGVIHLLDWTTGLDYWTGLLDWNTGMTFESKFDHKNETLGHVHAHSACGSSWNA